MFPQGNPLLWPSKAISDLDLTSFCPSKGAPIQNGTERGKERPSILRHFYDQWPLDDIHGLRQGTGTPTTLRGCHEIGWEIC